MNCKLILRSTHNMKLTDDGERCYRYGKNVLAAWGEFDDALNNAESQPSGLLRVRAPHAFGQDHLIAPLGDLLKQYPKLQIDWRLNDQTPDFIADNIDCAVHVGPVTDTANIARLLAEIPRIVVAAPALLNALPDIIHPTDLPALPWLSLSTFYTRAFCLTHKAEKHTEEVTIEPRLLTDSLYATKKAALNGLGLAVVSSWVVEDEIQRGELVHVLPQWQAASLPIYLIYPYANYYPARLRTFLSLMQDVMSDIVAGAAKKA